jgi:hypothetical protein
MNTHITPKSGNGKVGPIPVTTSSAETCPSSCPFNHANEGGCYADAGPLKLHWDKVTRGERGETWNEFLDSLVTTLHKSEDPRQLWRHNQAGDLPGNGNDIDVEQLADLVRVNGNRRGWTYTHKPVLDEQDKAETVSANREAVRMANEGGFTVNLSANNLRHADELASLGIAPVATVLPKETQGRKLETPGGRPVVVCPATLPGSSITCATCGLCAVGNLNRPIVGFPAHGTGAKKADAVASR